MSKRRELDYAFSKEFGHARVGGAVTTGGFMAISNVRRLGPQPKTRKVRRGESFIVRVYDDPQEGKVGKVIAVDGGQHYPFSNAEELWRIVMEEDALADTQ